jgi:hypothetical protein
MTDIKAAWDTLDDFERVMLANACEIFPEPLLADTYYYRTSLWLAEQRGELSSSGDCYWITPQGRTMVEQSELWPVPFVYSLLE